MAWQVGGPRTLQIGLRPGKNRWWLQLLESNDRSHTTRQVGGFIRNLALAGLHNAGGWFLLTRTEDGGQFPFLSLQVTVCAITE